MNYTVVWKATAKARLAEIWMAARDRTAIARAADEIDALLCDSPLDEGESRQEEFRVLFVKPLAVKYTVSEADRIVSIARVWTT
jgi:hypothetical protein